MVLGLDSRDREGLSAAQPCADSDAFAIFGPKRTLKFSPRMDT
jgi:hypothetical protein